MGGSGGGFFSGTAKPEDLARRTREAEARTHDDAFETKVEAVLGSALAEFNDRDTQAAQSVFESVTRDIGTDIEGTVDLLFGGSVSRHTYVDGLSDVDALVLMDRTSLKGESPAMLQQLLANTLRNRYPRSVVSVGALAVTLEHQGLTFQLLPALRHGDRFKIAAADGKGWSRIDPAGFAQALSRANKALDGKLVPCIKLAKAIVAGEPEKRRLTGYHTESLAIAIFKGYTGSRTPKAMLRHLFEKASGQVMMPITDSTGQSVNVDEYLGSPKSNYRRIVADGLGRIARRMRNADGGRSIVGWKELVE